jgi:membrane protein implicated in regulation of membrane protease activity
MFILAAATGGLVVLLRLALQLLGWGLDVDGDFDDAAGDSGNGFQVLTVRGLSSFFLMFGLTGLALARSGASAGGSILGGCAAGLVALWVIARLLKAARQLQSGGTLPSRAAEGCLGTVYTTIPAGGTGRITVRIGQRLRELDAVHADATALPTGTAVRVVRVERSVAVVEPFPGVPMPDVLNVWVLPMAGFILVVFLTLVFLASRYKRCPSDQVLVVFGKVGAGQSARCIHGGGVLVLPLVQGSAYLSLTPMTIAIPLQKALSMQNIRINVPSSCA